MKKTKNTLLVALRLLASLLTLLAVPLRGDDAADDMIKQMTETYTQMYLNNTVITDHGS